MKPESRFEISSIAEANTGEVGEVGRGAAGNDFQKAGSGGNE